jgi:hypothetical protein
MDQRSMPQTNDRPPDDRPLILRLNARQWLLVGAFAVLMAAGARDMHFNADTLHYVDVARTWLSEHTLATWHLNLASERVPATDILWPPMYSILLAGPLALGLSPEAATWLVAVASYVVVLWLLAAVSRRLPWGVLLALVFVQMMFAHGLAFRAFSETPFMAFSFASLAALALTLQGPTRNGWRSRTIWPALLAGGLAAAAALTRHIGLVLLPALGLVCLFGPLGAAAHRVKTRATAVVGLAVGAGLPLGLWFARHWMLGGSYFGPERPPSAWSVQELLRRAGQGIYIDATMPLLVIAAATLGYHLLQRDERASWRSFAVALAAGAVLFAIFHEVGTLASHGMYRLDNPPEGRQFFPGYAALLVAGAALISLARPPEQALRRRWALIAVVSLPILIGPLFAGAAALDLSPSRTAVDEWVEQNTSPDDLIIGWRAWTVRYFTGRPVLQGGMVTEPSVYSGGSVAEFLERFGSEFTGAYLLVPEGRRDARRAARTYSEAGLKLEQVAQVDIRDVRHYRGVSTFRIYRVTGWR